MYIFLDFVERTQVDSSIFILNCFTLCKYVIIIIIMIIIILAANDLNIHRRERTDRVGDVVLLALRQNFVNIRRKELECSAEMLVIQRSFQVMEKYSTDYFP